MDNSEDTFCNKTKFSVLCQLCESVANAKASRDKKILVRKFIEDYKRSSKQKQNDNIYPLMRLLVPQMERERDPYGIKEHALAKILIRILCLAKESIDAAKLLNYKVPKHAGADAGDFAEVAYWVLHPRFRTQGGTLTVHQINQYLDNIASEHKACNKNGVHDELQAMLLKMCATEQKWAIRILLKNLHLGVADKKILEMYHPKAYEMFAVCTDLNQVCTSLKEVDAATYHTSAANVELGIRLMLHFHPMRSQWCDLKLVDRILAESNAPFHYVQTKYDGERFQLHYDGAYFKYFSRKGHDYSEIYGRTSSEGTLSQFVAKQLNAHVQRCILDGEMMLWNTKSRSFTGQGVNIDVKKIKLGLVHRACFCVFDILLYNDRNLANVPLSERIAILDTAFTPLEGVIVNTDNRIAKQTSEVTKFLNEAIDNREEGIIVKHPDTFYLPACKGGGWYKIKPDYVDGVMEDLDLLIIGGYYGEGRWRGKIKSFLVAVAVHSSGANADSSVDGKKSLKFWSVGRVGIGCTMEELNKLEEDLRSLWKKIEPGKMPLSVEWSKEKPDMWIEPRNSCVLQIKVTEVMPSDETKVGYSLKFPRIVRIRRDKPWFECMTLDEFNNRRADSNNKLRTNYAKLGKTGDSAKASTSATRKRKETATVSDHLRTAPRDRIQKTSAIFEGLEICIYPGHLDDTSKKELEPKVIQMGGAISANPGANTYCIVADDGNTTRVKIAISTHRYDVVKSDWLRRCVLQNQLLDWCPDDVIAITDLSWRRMSRRFDQYGDSFTDATDARNMRIAMEKTYAEDEKPQITTSNICKLERLLFKNKPNKYSFFRGCYAYFDRNVADVCDNESASQLEEYYFRFCCGTIQERIDESEATTHIVINSRYSLNANKYARWYGKCSIVNEQWIRDSWNAKSKQSHEYYQLLPLPR